MHARTPISVLTIPTAIYAALIIVLWIVAFAHYRQPVPAVALYGVAGLGLWTFIEYLMHRFFLHSRYLPPIIAEWHRHRHHHDDPKNPYDIFFPVYYSLPILMMLFGIIFLCSQSLFITVALFPGLILGYVAYEWMHLGSHYHKTASPLLRELYGNHLKHHHKSDRAHYGVTTPIWDYIFGTVLFSRRR